LSARARRGAVKFGVHLATQRMNLTLRPWGRVRSWSDLWEATSSSRHRWCNSGIYVGATTTTTEIDVILVERSSPSGDLKKHPTGHRSEHRLPLLSTQNSQITHTSHTNFQSCPDTLPMLSPPMSFGTIILPTSLNKTQRCVHRATALSILSVPRIFSPLRQVCVYAPFRNL
jgi:hypothetical protein